MGKNEVHVCVRGTAHLKQLRREGRNRVHIWFRWSQLPPCVSVIRIRRDAVSRFVIFRILQENVVFVSWRIFTQHLDAPNCSLFTLFCGDPYLTGLVEERAWWHCAGCRATQVRNARYM